MAGKTVDWKEKSFESPPGSVDCDENVPRPPTPGVNLLEFAVNPLSAEQTGAKIFDFKRFTAKSCTR
jgi:hypothetical protein